MPTKAHLNPSSKWFYLLSVRGVANSTCVGIAPTRKQPGLDNAEGDMNDIDVKAIMNKAVNYVTRNITNNASYSTEDATYNLYLQKTKLLKKQKSFLQFVKSISVAIETVVKFVPAMRRGTAAFLRKRITKWYKFDVFSAFDDDIFANLLADPDYTNDDRLKESVRYLDTSDDSTEYAVSEIKHLETTVRQISILKDIVRQGKPSIRHRDYSSALNALGRKPRSDDSFWDCANYLIGAIKRKIVSHSEKSHMIYQLMHTVDPDTKLSASIAMQRTIEDKLKALDSCIKYLKMENKANNNKRQALFFSDLLNYRLCTTYSKCKTHTTVTSCLMHNIITA